MRENHRSALAFAPASTSNLAVGFDLFGHPIEALGDRVLVRRRAEQGVVIRRIDGSTDELPLDPTANTATVGLLRLIEDRGLEFGFEVEICKGIPLGSGMGGSAASAVAAIVAANALLPEPLGRADLFRYALAGEAVASGEAHGDNIAPSLLGGLVLVRSLDPLDVVQIPVPEALRCVIVRPHLRIETREARAVLPAAIPLRAHIEQSANLAGFVAGCFSGDLELIRRSLRDVVIEPHRAALIPGFHEVQRVALELGALGCSISGAGPSLFAWCEDDDAAARISSAMIAVFAEYGLEADGWTSPIAGRGAHLLEVT